LIVRTAVFAVVCGASALAWDTAPHRQITTAALDAVQPAVAQRLAPYTKDILETYVMLPDRCRDWTELPDPAAMKPFCLRPDGTPVHSASLDHDEDLESLIYLYERILTSASEKKDKDLAMYVGVLAHFIEDSLSPPHSLTDEELQELAPDTKWLHQKLERTVPPFTIAKRPPPRSGGSETMLETLDSIVKRLHASAARNREALPNMVKALKAGDEKALDAPLLQAAKDAAELLADALNAMFAEH
jgi:hypothetical protein